MPPPQPRRVCGWMVKHGPAAVAERGLSHSASYASGTRTHALHSAVRPAAYACDIAYAHAHVHTHPPWYAERVDGGQWLGSASRSG